MTGRAPESPIEACLHPHRVQIGIEAMHAAKASMSLAMPGGGKGPLQLPVLSRITSLNSLSNTGIGNGARPAGFLWEEVASYTPLGTVVMTEVSEGRVIHSTVNTDL